MRACLRSQHRMGNTQGEAGVGRLCYPRLARAREEIVWWEVESHKGKLPTTCHMQSLKECRWKGGKREKGINVHDPSLLPPSNVLWMAPISHIQLAWKDWFPGHRAGKRRVESGSGEANGEKPTQHIFLSSSPCKMPMEKMGQLSLREFQ